MRQVRKIHIQLYIGSSSVRLYMIKWCDVEKRKVNSGLHTQKWHVTTNFLFSPIWFSAGIDTFLVRYVKCQPHSQPARHTHCRLYTVRMRRDVARAIHVVIKCNKCSNQWIKLKYRISQRAVSASRRVRKSRGKYDDALVDVNCDVNCMTYDYIIFGFVLLARFCYCLKSITRIIIIIIIRMGIGMKMGNDWHSPCCARVAAASQRIATPFASERKEWNRASDLFNLAFDWLTLIIPFHCWSNNNSK